MFSGIIDHCGHIIELIQGASGQVLTIASQFKDFELGESISVDGICLTVTAQRPGQFQCDVSPETLQVTTAAEFTVGRLVNLERALCFNAKIGGHLVSGHVDSVATVAAIEQLNDYWELTIGSLAADALKYLFKKGSIAINGVSLTVNEITTDGFKVMLIPHTLERTNLKHLQVGTQVNLEFDWMSKVLIRQYEQIRTRE